MHRFLKIFLIPILLFSCSQENKNSNGKLIDDLGNTVSVNLPVKKAVSLAPNLTEIIYYIGAENQLIANTVYCDVPAAAKNKIKVGDLLSVDYEKIMSLKPDIVLMTVEGNSKSQYEKLKELGFAVFVSNPRNPYGIMKTIIDFGKIFGKEKTAEKKANKFKNALDSISSVCKSFAGRKALFLISVKPLIAAGKNTFINSYLEICKLQNAVGESAIAYPNINAEELLKQNPDLILLPEKQRNLFEELIRSNEILENVKAVSLKRILYVNPDLYFRPGPRFIEAAEDLARKLAE